MLFETAHVTVLVILERRRANLQAGAAKLLEQETLTQDELESIIGGSNGDVEIGKAGRSI